MHETLRSHPGAPIGGQAVQQWTDKPSYRAAVGHLPIRSILVVKLDHVGDFVLALDALTILAAGFADAVIDLACAPWNVALARSLGLFATIYPVTFFASRADAQQPRFDPACLADLQERTWDLAIDLRVDTDTRVVLAFVSAAARVGFQSDDQADILTLALPHRLAAGDNMALHQTLLMLRLVRSTLDLFQRGGQVRQLLLDKVAEPAGIDLSAASGRILVALNTASGRAAKNWPADRFARLVRWLVLDLDVAVILLGSADQQAEAAGLVASCGVPHLISAVGRTTLRQAIALVAEASLFIGNDSGLTHVAARLDIPVVALFSGIDPTVMWAPLGAAVTVLKVPVACSPCHIQHLADCIGGHACVRGITEAAVRSAVRRHLFGAARLGGRVHRSHAVAIAPDSRPTTWASMDRLLERLGADGVSGQLATFGLGDDAAAGMVAIGERLGCTTFLVETGGVPANPGRLDRIGALVASGDVVYGADPDLVLAPGMRLQLALVDAAAIPADRRLAILTLAFQHLSPGGALILHRGGAADVALLETMLAGRPECIVPFGEGGQLLRRARVSTMATRINPPLRSVRAC